jgi:undecaprenyl-diphosphatase
MDLLVGLDVSIFRTLNGFVGRSPTLDRVAVHSEVLKGSLFMGIVGVLWYWPDKVMSRRRETILVIMLAVALSLVANRVLSTLLPYRARPMYGIGANKPTFQWSADLDRWSSFPSDNAAYLFAIAAGFWLISRWWGLMFGVFAAFAVVLARVYLGLHYPSDVLVGALIGIATTLAVDRDIVRKRIAEPILVLESRYPPYFYGLFFLALAEVSAGFPNVRRIGTAIVRLFIGYDQ